MEKDTGPFTADQEYLKLLDEFYQEYYEVVSKEQYERAEKDSEYFKSLIRNVTDLYQRIGRELLQKDRNYHVWEKQFRRQKEE